jgi:type VI secretion system protein ImpA
MSPLPPIESFLEDISPKMPAGEFLFYDPTYDAIKEARRMDDTLPQGLWVQDLKVSDWGKVASLCIEALQKKSKDLQICGWLIEAWVFLHGLEGVQHGFDLLEQLSQKYWDILYPSIEKDGDKDFRLSPYIWMNEKLSERLKFIPVSSPSDAYLQPINFAQYIDTKRYWSLSNDSSMVVPADKQALLDLFEKNIQQTDKAFFNSLKPQCAALIETTGRIEQFLNQKCTKEEAPTFQKFRSILEEIMDFSDQVILLKPSVENPLPSTEDSDRKSDGDAVLPMTSNQVVVGEKGAGFKGLDISSLVKSREEAYQVIRSAADYLEKLDPHSPVPHMLKRAVGLGAMPLKSLLQEIIKEPLALAEVQHLLGLSDKSIPS